MSSVTFLELWRHNPWRGNEVTWRNQSIFAIKPCFKGGMCPYISETRKGDTVEPVAAGADLLWQKLSSPWRVFCFHGGDKWLSGPFPLQIMIPGTSWRVKGGPIPSPLPVASPLLSSWAPEHKLVLFFPPTRADGGGNSWLSHFPGKRF